jgi:hypothetical protein
MGGWVGGGMDTNIYIACLRQVVAFAPKVIYLLIFVFYCSYRNKVAPPAYNL